MDLTRLAAYLTDAPAGVDVAALQRTARALDAAYDVNQWRLPLPLWAQRPYSDSGAMAWETAGQIAAHLDPARALCIYLHVPFCDSKCGFCDSYSFKLGNHSERLAHYTQALCDEARLWSAWPHLAQRPISTVHLGGGTPALLGSEGLTQIVETCRVHFATHADTEWALESTVAALTPEMMTVLHELGFRRLHVGVQSLHADVRAALGRRRSPAEVMNTITQTLARGWVVSVDLICGLPGQTLAGFVSDIETLCAAGVDGFSLYELLLYPQNAHWAESYRLTQRDHLANYAMFMAGAGVLAARGYRKNLFNHWATARDDNRYFTFPTRGEDLLALGCIADGVFGHYHYRHARYAPYMRARVAGAPGLEGGLWATGEEDRLQPLITAILSGDIEAALLAKPPHGPALAERWRAHGLINEAAPGHWQLTDSGSWLAGNMVAEATGQIPQSVYGRRGDVASE